MRWVFDEGYDVWCFVWFCLVFVDFFCDWGVIVVNVRLGNFLCLFDSVYIFVCEERDEFKIMMSILN